MKKILITLAIMITPIIGFASKYVITQIMTNASLGASVNSSVVDLNQINLLSVQAIWTGGTAAGTLNIQVSNDNVQKISDITNWTDYTGSSTTIAGAGDILYNMTFAGYRWMRLHFVRTSGTGTINATMSGKGIN